MIFGWNDSFALGIAHIDAQHKQLFAIIHDLHEAMRTRQTKAVLGQTLERLLDYTVKHFSAEEAMLRSKNYGELAQHKLIHDQFTARIRNFQEQHKAGALTVNVELMNMLQKWLVDHIQQTDRRYAQALAS